MVSIAPVVSSLSEWKLVSVEEAKVFLQNRLQNRKLSVAHVETLAYAMSTGKYQANPHGLVFDKNGRLLDGQHRLTAQVLAGVPVLFHVTWGAESSLVEVIDQGRARTVADTEMMTTGDEFASKKQAIVGAICRLETRRVIKISKQMYDDTLANLGIEHVDAVVSASRHRIPASLSAALVYARPLDPVRIDAVRVNIEQRAVDPGPESAMLRVLGDSATVRAKPVEAILKFMRGLAAVLANEAVERLQKDSELGYRWLMDQRERRGLSGRVVPASFYSLRDQAQLLQKQNSSP